MTTLVSLLGRKPAPGAGKSSIAPAPTQPSAKAPAPAAAASEKPDIELDNELFSPIATQLGQENEAVRNLLLDAEHKMGELETIKRSIGKLVDPVSKTLRAYEETKSEKLSLQGTLNTTRTAYNKLRDDLAVAEKKATTFEAECTRLRDVVSVAQQSIEALERIKAEQFTELGARRTHIAELQRHAQQQASELQSTRDENRKITERIAMADKRAVQVEGQALAAQQKAMQAAQERASVQASLDKALAEYAQIARRLSDIDKTLVLTQGRLKASESNLSEAQAERARLSAALDEANHKHFDEMNLQNSRFEALQARSNLTENLLEEARQTLMARADEIRTFERRVIESATVHDVNGEKHSQLEAALAERERQVKELEDARTALAEQMQALSYAAAARQSAFNAAQQRAKEQSDLVELLEKQLHAARDANEMQVEQLNAQLQREQLERSMAEGALEAGRKDIARLMREVAALQYRPVATTASEAPPDRLRTAA
jgi:chromosome segregation ATPase